MDEEINKLNKHLADVIDFSVDNLDEECLTEIRNKMGTLIEQEIIWVEQENEERYYYELKKFLTWLCDYVLIKHDEYQKDES